MPWTEVEKPANRLKIALVGKSKTANTFCAGYLRDTYKFRFYGLDDEMDKFLRRLHNTKYTFRPRMHFQNKLKFYDAWHRVDPDIWIRHLLYRVNEARATRNVVVPDARYMNEIKALEADGFIFIRVTVDDKYYSKKANNIKTLLKTTNPGAVDYYEWFGKDVNFYINAKYSVHMESQTGIKRALDAVIKDLTNGELKPYTKPRFQKWTTEEADAKKKERALNADIDRGNQ